MMVLVGLYLRATLRAILLLAFAITVAVAVHTLSLLMVTDINAEDMKQDFVFKAATAIVIDSIPAEYKASTPKMRAVSALAYLLSRVGETVTVKDIQSSPGQLRGDTSTDQIAVWAGRVGYKLEMNHRRYMELPDDSQLPVLVKLLNSHYVVVHNADAKGVVLFDPRFGEKVWVNARVFKSQWGGIVLGVLL